MSKWSFWIDRGGTFTDIVGVSPSQEMITAKLLSKNPNQYRDASIAGIKKILELNKEDPIPEDLVNSVKIGTTIATNALLEHKGEPTVLAITQGFGDALKIGYQNRPEIFDLEILLPKQLYDHVIEIEERVLANGEILLELYEESVYVDLKQAFDQGFRSLAIVLMHGYAYPQHEKRIEQMAKEIGFTQISVSHETIPLMKLISRGETTVIDAYLSPLLKQYIADLKKELGTIPIYFMQSNGGLTTENLFRGKESILSGPAGGVVGMVKTGENAGYKKIIGFDMGGTSTDVSHYKGEYERQYETEISGIKLRSPMLHIHTIAAGGGSIIQFKNGRYIVGPDSAGANPGPACYRQNGPLTLTDCNVLLGKIQSDYFPKIFGPNGKKPIDVDIVKEKFTKLQQCILEETGQNHPIEYIAEGFLEIAIENMANAIKKISIAKGYDTTDYLLNGFGGAAGQHVCRVADALGMHQILLHPHAGVLSAVGIGLADFRNIVQRNIEKPLTETLSNELKHSIEELKTQCTEQFEEQGIHPEDTTYIIKAHIRYEGTDTDLPIHYSEFSVMESKFRELYYQQFGFIDTKRKLIVTSLSLEGVSKGNQEDLKTELPNVSESPMIQTKFYTNKAWVEAQLFIRSKLQTNQVIEGPTIIIEPNATTIIEPEWQGVIQENGNLLLTRKQPKSKKERHSLEENPILLEVFNNRFMNIAEQMGIVLKNTACSVNIKERLDFSCAIFDSNGELIANAPHIPVHLGSMSESVKSVINTFQGNINPEDVFITNDPYNGGTHLPDITVITPVFDKDNGSILFYTGSRGHHADIGGITPGSMPANSHSIQDEGAYITNRKIVDEGEFLENEILKLFIEIPHPARNPKQNIEDLKAQIAANHSGVKNLQNLCEEFSTEVVTAYMQHVRKNAKKSVQEAIKKLHSGQFRYALDDNNIIQLSVTVDKEKATATFDFTGTSPQLHVNYNAPKAVTIACVIYVMRCLVQENIPLNAGCLEPIEIIIPENNLLNPTPPSPVVAGNVETSQSIVDTIFGALQVIAASQGTTNSFTFGNDTFQYYETICGGAGAGKDFPGASAVHTHITNTRLTDPEVLEWRFPVLLESFSIRKSSGGKGNYNGGDGVIRRILFLEPMIASILSSHRKHPPCGMKGGAPGKIGENWVERSDGTIKKLTGCATVEMEKGDIFVICTPGGGGYGIIDKDFT
ncbi:MAG: hydantoinase B/oxoprolinase family protein [Chlamydiota bacterium]